MKPMNLQEDSEEALGARECYQRRLSHGDEASWVITCKGDHEEEITLFGGETAKKMVINEISTVLSNFDNVKMSPEGFDSEVTRTVSCARVRFRTHC